jgi:hypothetical protein
MSLCVFTVYALRWQRILAALGTGAVVPLPTLVGFRAAAHAVASLLPSAHWSGEPVRALLLRRRGLDWPTAVLAVAADRLAEISAASILGPTYVTVFLLGSGASFASARWVLAAMAAAAIALGIFYARLLRGGLLVSRFLSKRFFESLDAPVLALEKRLSEFVRSRAFLESVLLSFFAEALIIAEFWTLTRAFQLLLPLPMILGVLVGMGVSHLVPIPGAIGSLEATQVGVSALSGGSADLGLAIGLLVRLRETLWIVVGLAVLVPLRKRAAYDPSKKAREDPS